jgi:hypothetical protein
VLSRIKRADQVAAYYEAVRLAGFVETEAVRLFGRPGPVSVDAIGEFVVAWPARKAESRYLAGFAAVSASLAEEPA